jgi:hypothetical protein
MPRAKGRVFIEVPETLRDKIRELATKHNLTYEELLWKALELFTQGNTLGRQQPKPVHVTLWPNDPFWYLIRVGEGLYATEISLNLIQMSKLCATGLLAKEVCKKVQSMK